MVRGGTRSGRCLTCERRKLGCDKQRPACQRCLAAGLSCAGYVRQPVFVDETRRFHGPRRPQSPSNSSSRSTASATSLAVSRRDAIRSLAPDEASVFRGHFLAHLIVGGAELTPLFRVLVRLVTSSAALTSDSHLVRQPLPLHEACIDAMTMSYFATTHGNARIYGRGMAIYGRALAKLQRRLAHTPSAIETETLVSVLCLGLYENVVRSDATAWLRHYEGMTRLIELRGPSRHRHGIDKTIFEACRFMIIISAALERRHCYLARPGWKALTQALPDEPRNPSTSLLDTAADVPGIFHDIDRLRASASGRAAGPEYEASVAALRQRTQRTLTALHQWPLCPTPFPLAVPTPAPTSAPAASAITPFLALRQAVLLVLEDACAFLSLTMMPVPDPLAGLRIPDLGVAVGVEADFKRGLALDIMRLASSVIPKGRKGGSFFGALYFILPLHVAAMHLDSERLSTATVRDYMETVIVKEQGFRLGQDLELA